MGNPQKICFIGYGKLTEMARHVIHKLNWAQEAVLVIDSTVDGLHRCIDDAVAQGCQVFIAGSANAAEFQRYSGATLVELKLNPIDFAIAIHKALQQGKRPAVVSYRFSKVINPNQMSMLFDRPVQYLFYQTDEELQEILSQCDADILIGASRVKEIAEQLGKEHIFIYPGEEMIVDALRRANTMVQLLQKERRNSQLVHSILEESPIGIVGFSENREVVIINKAAQRFTGLSAEQIRRTKLKQFIADDQFYKILTESGKAVFPILHTGIQNLKMQLEQLEQHGQTLGALLLIEVLEHTQPSTQVQYLAPPADMPTFKDAICISTAMKKVVSLAKLYGKKTDAPLLLTGEHGTGKELFAQCIHSFCRSQYGNYVALNCAAIVGEQAPEILFRKHGKEQFETTQSMDMQMLGTLVLENIWDADERLQDCLLWVLKGRGQSVFDSRENTRIQLCVITIVPDEKWSLCLQRIRPDLLHSLDTFRLAMPPLRERQADIVPLFSLWLRNDPSFSRPGSRTIDPLKEVLTSYHWPGNVTELQSVCRRYALQVSTAGRITPAGKQRLLIACIGEEKLVESILAQSKCKPPFDTRSGPLFAELVEAFKRILLYNNDEVADRLGMSRTMLWRKLRAVEQDE